MDESETLEYIELAKRDGVSELLFLEAKRDFINKRHTKIGEQQIKSIDKAEFIFKEMPYEKQTIPTNCSFRDCLIDSGYKTELDQLKNKYVVLDVETNGIRKSNDDLLSISLYDPTSGICYNRFLPLDLQPTVLTGWINGIKDADLRYKAHLGQE